MRQRNRSATAHSGSASGIQVTDVSLQAAGIRILDGISMEARPGRVTGIIGPNGAGKSSLMRILAGISQPSSGEVVFEGQSVATIGRRVMAQRVSFVAQEESTELNPTVREVIDLGRLPHRRSWSGASSTDIEAVARAASITGLADRLDQRYSSLSGGERRRVQIARAFASRPEVLILDEPTNHLDVQYQYEVLRLSTSLAATTIVSLHDLNLAAAFCDDVVLMADGRIRATGSASDVLTESLIDEVYGMRAQVNRDEHGLWVRIVHGEANQSHQNAQPSQSGRNSA
ncbi:putative ABC transporter ATP-binding protein [Gordonia effusa NBRC 100432]|uniref:Putative ABC transporter ATP-binding protein n=1 Tax=Gordonia effusa NBRC 100432 TaxID=1077974 RepID=H0QX80_9ACTN|nr:ABC transporter ATP-binding protein [Gordonia effusa]GAB17431.1 putative ABC transporter ATP-binding protein [Gordonia effusa NBRC 100432]